MSQCFPIALHRKVVHDPVHGLFNLYPYCTECVDTPQFQRLRDLKQLGTTYLVFPGACHNRFEHSLGVSHLAGVWLERFRSGQPELGITDRDVRIVRLAGLLHDLGHGAYSHVWDRHFVPAVSVRKPHLRGWTHEAMSQRMFEYMVDDNALDLDREEVRTINELIHPPEDDKGRLDYDHLALREKLFMYEIVNNRKTSVDVDKFDYLARDCYHLGVPMSYDFSRLLNFSKVIDNAVSFYAKECYNVYSLFHTRYSLFKIVYHHRVAQAMEYMVTDALLAADDYLKLSDSCDSPERFTVLTDHVLRTIEASCEPELAKSREIMRKLRTRQLYKFVDEIVVDSDSPEAHVLASSTAAEFVTHQQPGETLLLESDVIVAIFSLNYAAKDRNPVDSVPFYTHADPDESFTIDKRQVSYLIPSKFEENIMRVFCKDESKLDVAKHCMRNFVRHHHLGEPVPPSSGSPRRTAPRSLQHGLDRNGKRRRLFDISHSPLFS